MLKKHFYFAFFLLSISLTWGFSEQNRVALVAVSTQYEFDKIPTITQALESRNYVTIQQIINSFHQRFIHH